jgi:hypothetical protein
MANESNHGCYPFLSKFTSDDRFGAPKGELFLIPLLVDNPSSFLNSGTLMSLFITATSKALGVMATSVSLPHFIQEL